MVLEESVDDVVGGADHALHGLEGPDGGGPIGVTVALEGLELLEYGRGDGLPGYGGGREGGGGGWSQSDS